MSVWDPWEWGLIHAGATPEGATPACVLIDTRCKLEVHDLLCGVTILTPKLSAAGAFRT
jgi:hypothetical protein